MSRPNVFNPHQFITGGVEDDSTRHEPLQMAYAINDVVADSLEPIEDDDGFRELHDQLAVINGFAQQFDELDELIVKVQDNNVVTTADFAAIESKFPGVFTSGMFIGLEHYDWNKGTITVEPALEAMKALKGGLALIGVMAILRFMLKWIGQTFATATPPKAETVSAEPGLLSAVIGALTGDPMDLFKEYKPKDGGDDDEDEDEEEADADETDAETPKKDATLVAKDKLAAATGKVKKKAADVTSKVAVTKDAKFSASIRQMTYPGITQEEVNELFKDKKISYARLLKYQPKAFTYVLRAPVLAVPDGIKTIERDVEFLKDPQALAALKAFIDDLSGLGKDLQGWQNNIREGGGENRHGQPVTPEQPLPPIDGSFAVLAQKKLNWALTQPQTEGNKVILQTISQSSVQEMADLYQPVKTGDKDTPLPKLDHLDDLTPYVKALTELSEALPKWQAVLKSKEKEFINLVAQVNKYNQEFKDSDKMPDDQKKAMAYMTGHINKAFSNFKSILVWLSTIAKWNTILCKRINSMVLGMQNLRRVVGGDTDTPATKSNDTPTKEKEDDDDE